VKSVLNSWIFAITTMETESAEKKNYELSFLVKDENDAREVLKLLAQHEAEVRGEGPLRKLNLAYPIKHVPQAYFGFVNLAVLPANAKSLERDLSANTAILRTLMVKLPKGKTAVVTSGEYKKTMRPIAQRRPVRMEAPSQPKPLSNEALEKKIEEILQ